MFESGALGPQVSRADRKRGNSGEVSRFQIMPEVWHAYTSSRDYENPEVAWAVAYRILADRIRDFRQSTGRVPIAVEVYLLWNKPEHFRNAGFSVSRVRGLYRTRAQRFANLIQLPVVSNPLAAR
jgi:hypothetical protein